MKHFWRLVTVLLILCVGSYLWFYGIDAVRSVFFWLSVILAAAVGLYAFQRFPFVDSGSLSGGLFAVLLPLIGIVVLHALVFLPLYHPPEQPFEEQLTVEPGTEEGREAFQQVDAALREWERVYERTADSVDDEDLNRALRNREINPTARRVLDETSTARRRIMDRLVTSAPVRPVEEVRLKGQELPIVEYFTLLRLELLEAQQLQEAGELKRSMDRYENLWRATGNLLEPPLPFIRYLAGIAVTEDLMDFYLSRRLWERDEAGTLGTLAADFSQKLDRAGYRAMAVEYRLMLEGLRSIREEASGDVGGDVSEAFTGGEQRFLSFFLTWPVFDYYATKRMVHDYYHQTAILFVSPFYTVEDEVDRLETRLDESLVGPKEFGLTDWLYNPIGKLLYNEVIPKTHGGVVDKGKAQSRLTILRFVASNPPPFEDAEVPVDPLSGGPYRVKDHADTSVISSSYEGPRDVDSIEYVLEH